MNLYLVRNDRGRAVWVAWEDDEMRIWSYLQNTGKFHLNQGLYLDFYFDQNNTYEPATVETARQAIRDGVGHLDARVWAHRIRRFEADPAARAADEVLRHG
ncbi:hypothetical protein DY023_04070 [Microbacterium bovistercoris]|uniref:Uncharacterized protein n=1 Tax=Microbacterium bovistercoris TaxID=2293570 RepID=A0A371NWG6_9MICO|nr:hypothetical protein [Microbacterium bovistercoris]REJ07383.1 hypothetical protein DY023_04070 [Microbacterium bovistercoris]